MNQSQKNSQVKRNNNQITHSPKLEKLQKIRKSKTRKKIRKIKFNLRKRITTNKKIIQLNKYMKIELIFIHFLIINTHAYQYFELYLSIRNNIQSKDVKINQ